MTLTPVQKQKLQQIGKKYNLKLILLHGSYARERARKGSDLDVAVLGNKVIEFKTLLKIHYDLSDVFGDNRERELDIKSLHNVTPLFCFEVMKDGILLFGKLIDYYSFKIYAQRNFQESKGLFNLLDVLVRKRQEYLMQTYVE